MALTIDSFAKKCGFTIKDKIAYKKEKNFMITISQSVTSNLRCCISIDEKSISDLDKRSITRFINSNYQNYRINKFRWDESGIDVTFQKLDSKLFECFTAFCMEVTTELEKVQAKGLETCTICGKANNKNSTLFYLYGFVCGVHKPCMDKYDKETNVTKVNTKKYSRGNLLSGIFGSIWGAFIGTLLLMICLAFFADPKIREWVPLTAFLVPIAVKFYYEVLDGSQNAWVKFGIVMTVSVLSTVFAVAFGNSVFTYSQTRDIVFDWFCGETYFAVGVAAAMALLLDYNSVKLKGTKQAYKVD